MLWLYICYTLLDPTITMKNKTVKKENHKKVTPIEKNNQEKMSQIPKKKKTSKQDNYKKKFKLR